MFDNKKTLVMGILNITPDSFSDGGLYIDPDTAASHAQKMISDGADIIDIGGQSTRPGFTVVSSVEEKQRILPVIKKIRSGNGSCLLSIDTFYPEVARCALEYGVNIINDVTGFYDQAMVSIAVQSGCGCIIMHCADITGFSNYDEAINNINAFFAARFEALTAAGIKPQNICFDPGIGFGKTYEQNLYILANYKKLCPCGCGLMVAASRKRVIMNSCECYSPEKTDTASAIAHLFAVSGGANVIRTHNVAATVQSIKTVQKLKGINRNG